MTYTDDEKSVYVNFVSGKVQKGLCHIIRCMVLLLVALCCCIGAWGRTQKQGKSTFEWDDRHCDVLFDTPNWIGIAHAKVTNVHRNYRFIGWYYDHASFSMNLYVDEPDENGVKTRAEYSTLATHHYEAKLTKFRTSIILRVLYLDGEADEGHILMNGSPYSPSTETIIDYNLPSDVFYSLQAVPASECHEFVRWDIQIDSPDASSAETSYAPGITKVVDQSDITYTAVFRRKKFVVTATSDDDKMGYTRIDK